MGVTLISGIISADMFLLQISMCDAAV